MSGGADRTGATGPGPMRTPLGRVRGHGAAKGGTHHFIAQRASAIALMVLLPWFVISAALNLGRGAAADAAWVAQPINAVPLILFVLAAFYHMRLGMQTVIEDYISKAGTRAALLLANTFVTAGLAVAAVFSILRISFGS